MEYECKYCKKVYKLKVNYEQHLPVCMFFYSKDKDYEMDNINEKIPKQKEMYSLIKHMMKKIDKLEKEISSIKQTQRKKTTKDILEWLNASQKPKSVFSIWFKENIMKNTRFYLETVFTNSLSVAIIQLFEDVYSKFTIEDTPLRIFENKTSCIYIFKKDDKNNNIWFEENINYLDDLIDAVSNQFLNDFVENWYLKYKSKIESDEVYKDLYMKYNKKISGDNDRNTMKKTIREQLYKKLKKTIKCVKEYEFI